MNISPNLSEVREIAATGQYNVLPVSCELLSDFTTPIETLKILKNVSTHCYLLESAQANETWRRYSFLGFDPKLEITCIDGEMKAGNVRMHTKTPPAIFVRSLPITKAPVLIISPPSQANSSATSPSIISDTANHRYGAGWRIRRTSRMLI